VNRPVAQTGVREKPAEPVHDLDEGLDLAPEIPKKS